MKIVLCITGSIAAYKTPELIRLFKKSGDDVRCILTEAGSKFVTASTLEVLSGHPVTTSFWSTAPGEIGHIELADWADVVLVAPASADAIAKIRTGIADEPMYATLLASKSKVVVAPAMNVNMWEAAVTQENISVLKSRGVDIVEPEAGELACGWTGSGRLAQLEAVGAAVHKYKKIEGPLSGKKVLVITGPTREYIDPVRYISNESSGRMGLAIVEEAIALGAAVTVISGPVALSYPVAAPVTHVVTARDMLSAAFEALGNKPDIVVMCAAVADVRTKTLSKEKIKKTKMPDMLELTSNPDIIATLVAKNKHKKTVFIGFNVETGSERELINESLRKCTTKGLHYVVGNLAKNSFGKMTNEVVIVNPRGDVEKVSQAPKGEIAQRLFKHVIAKSIATQ
jgi:phosphopantothenoylcysteine decarboxylase/phosphopantothenate--cysteine ligase